MCAGGIGIVGSDDSTPPVADHGSGGKGSDAGQNKHQGQEHTTMTMELERRDCKHCGSVYNLHATTAPAPGPAAVACEVCGTELVTWTGSTGYWAELLERKEPPST
jgi:ribosomal protein S27E